MAKLQINIDPLWYGIDNTQRRIVAQGSAEFLPDDPTAATPVYTYTPGGIRAIWHLLEPIKATNLMPLWVQLESVANSGLTYVWSPGASVTNVAIADGELTVTANNSFADDDLVTFRYLTGDADVLNGWGLAVTPHRPLRVTDATSTTFKGEVGILELGATQTQGLAVPIKYGPLVPPPLPPTLPSDPPMGQVMIMSGTSEASAINPQDVILVRAEFMRSYQ